MAVAWIGDQETPLGQAAQEAAALLRSSRCPVFTIDADIDGTRAAIGLARLVGAAYDHPAGVPLARETALFTGHGGIFIAPGEALRRADVVVVVGALPEVHLGFLAELAATVPDLSGTGERRFFVVGDARQASGMDVMAEPLWCGNEAATLAALRAQCAGRRVGVKVANFDRFAAALAAARFSVFLFSGRTSEAPAVEMLQGLIADLNRRSRAAALFLPASETAWGSTLASTWLTGFPMRTGFSRGFAEHDPWRFDVGRMLSDGEADLHLRIATRRGAAGADGGWPALVAIESTSRPVDGAAVTIAVGEPCVDHDAVHYCGRTGTLVFARAAAASSLPAAAYVLRAIAGRLPAGAAAPC